MASWRDEILKEFTPQLARLTLVADPDGLLLEEGVLHGIRERGFEIIAFDDHVAFRFAYESKYRSLWDRGELTDLVVVLRSPAADLRSLPFDLLQAGRELCFDLGDLFPNLSYPVVASLDRSDLEALYRAQKQHKPGVLGDNATKEFVLRHVFEIAPEVIKQASDLLRILLRRHHQGHRIPAQLDERWIHILQQSGRFEDWGSKTSFPIGRHSSGSCRSDGQFSSTGWPVNRPEMGLPKVCSTVVRRTCRSTTATCEFTSTLCSWRARSARSAIDTRRYWESIGQRSASASIPR